jgi:hypothetical protein
MQFKHKTTLTSEEFSKIELIVLDYLETKEFISNREIRNLTGIGYDQAIFFFASMIENRILIKVGASSATKYCRSKTPNNE